MGRGRGKGKKQSAIASRDDNGSGEDEKLPVRRRGRPQKPMKDEIQVEDEVENIQGEDEDSEETKNLVSNNSGNNQSGAENDRKRKRPSQIKEIADSVTEENGIGTKTNPTALIKTVGYRQIGSRRKNKPRRAAESSPVYEICLRLCNEREGGSSASPGVFFSCYPANEEDVVEPEDDKAEVMRGFGLIYRVQSRICIQ